MKNVLFGFCSTLLILTLGACGGGGNGGRTPPVEPLVIDAANAQTVASKSVEAALESEDLSEFADITGLTGIGSSGGNVSKLDIVRTASLSAKAAASGSFMSEVPFGPVTVDCVEGGTVTISGDIADQATLTAGDFFNFDWNNCNDGLGAVIDGAIEYTITNFVFDDVNLGALLGFSLTFTAFQVTEGADVSSVDGDLSLTVDTRALPTSVVTVSGNSFTVSFNAESETLSNFSSTITEDFGVFPTSYTIDSLGTIVSADFDGSVTYDTPVPFVSAGFAPHTGELLVTGANNATLLIIALDEINVRIEADYDGDGTVDEIIDTTWDALSDQTPLA